MAGSRHLKIFRVSRATARVLGAGHPWILPDADSDDPAGFRPGSLVQVVGPRGRELGWARMEGPGRIAARMWAPAGSRPEGDAQEVDSRIESAVQRRKPLLERGSSRTFVHDEVYTDALRLIHGEADGLPGLAVDLLGPLLRLGISGSASAGLLGSVVQSLESRLPDLGIEGFRPWVEVRYETSSSKPNPSPIRWREMPPSAWLQDHVDAANRVCVRERGLVFGVDPGFSEPMRPRPGVGLFLDQRENRARLARRAQREGGEWLNLFAHTGAFSVALLAAGAERVVSVDLSASYLAWLQENLERNSKDGVDLARHESVRKEGRRYMASLPPEQAFAGIVLDPPTAASAGRRYWSIKRDLEPLVGDCLERLQPGGVLMVSRNDRFSPAALRQLVERIARRRHVPLLRLDVTGPGPDFPRIHGFHEGDPFCGVVAQRSD
ncbi:MAG: class I SAM-dependent methyltransferase [Myxococcota bacterium]|nr:class I SAM-dependent methyltransferase [Myxococcota bacterium]